MNAASESKAYTAQGIQATAPTMLTCPPAT
jgi:hypothetical protein